MISQEERWLSLDELQSSGSEHEKSLLALLHPLLTVESLTQGLESLDSMFSVNVIELSETTNYYSDTDKQPVQICRKVELKLSGKAVIYAESLCPIHANECKEYLNCGTSSLGRRLFSSETKIARSPFSYAIFPVKRLPSHITTHFEENQDIVCARRSYFTIDGEYLLITEWYLPALIEKIKNDPSKY